MITPLDIENKKFSKRALNGYSTEEVDDFLDELTIDYEKIYKEVNESRKTIEDLNSDISKYRQMEVTLQNTLVMAQNAAEEMKSEAEKQAEETKSNAERQAEETINTAKKQAEAMITNAETSAREEINRINSDVEQKKMELDEMQKKLNTFKAEMEALLMSQLDLLKNSNNRIQ